MQKSFECGSREGILIASLQADFFLSNAVNYMFAFSFFPLNHNTLTTKQAGHHITAF